MLAAKPTVTTQVTEVSSTRDSITVQWALSDDGGSQISGYRLYQTDYATGIETLAYDGTLNPLATSYRVTGLTEGAWYQFRVAAINRAGEGEKSPENMDPIQAAQVPAKSEVPTFVAATASTVTLGFQPTRDNGGSAVLEYKLYFVEALTAADQNNDYTQLTRYADAPFNAKAIEFVTE